MRLSISSNNIKQRILHSFRPHKRDQSSPYTPESSYTSILGSSDRLIVAHPSPTVASPKPSSDNLRTPRPRTRSCRICTQRLELYEFPERLPTKKCRHENTTCVYCLHNSVCAAFKRGGWKSVECLTCRTGMSEEEGRALILLWTEEDEA
jgi:hypothetical protein